MQCNTIIITKEQQCEFKTITSFLFKFKFIKKMTKLNIDCLILIFNELKTDKNSLHSCLLVNREWCNLVVPILWEKYLWKTYWRYAKEKLLFITILSCLPLSSKKLLLDNDIIPTIPLKLPLFDYISFFKFLDFNIIYGILKMMKKEFNVGPHHKKMLLQEICRLFISQCKNIKELSCETSLVECLLPLVPEASTFFSQLYCLSVNTDFVDSNVLYKVAQICKDLNKLVISGYESNPGLISIVDAQKNLKCIKLILYYKYERGTQKELGEALARKCNTIEELDTYLASNSITPSFLISLTNLKRININTYLENEELQRCLEIVEFPKLQYLHVKMSSLYAKALAMLIEKTKGNLLQVYAHFYDSIKGEHGEDIRMLIKAVASNCSKIESLSTYLDPKEFIDAKLLLLNCRNLVYLKFFHTSYYNDDVGDELLEILTKFSPKSLKNISLSGCLEYSIDALERFFESCRGKNLLRFKIDRDWYITEDHKAIFRKYIDEEVIKDLIIFRKQKTKKRK